MKIKILGIYTEILGGERHGELIHANYYRIELLTGENISPIGNWTSAVASPVELKTQIYIYQRSSFGVNGKKYVRYFYVHDKVSHEYFLYLAAERFKNYFSPLLKK